MHTKRFRRQVGRIRRPMETETKQTAAPVVEINNLRYGWPGANWSFALQNFELASAERIFVHGPSGCGKSTLLSLIAGIHTPDSGTIRLLGQDLGAMNPGDRDRLRGRDVGFVFQQFNLVGYLSVIENVLLPLTFSTARRRRVEQQASSSRVEAARLLTTLGLDEAAFSRAPGELSVGQQQRVAVARALLGRPKLIICDEPTSALDADARDGFLDVLIDQCEATAAALIFVSHDQSLGGHFTRQLNLRTVAGPGR